MNAHPVQKGHQGRMDQKWKPPDEIHRNSSMPCSPNQIGRHDDQLNQKTYSNRLQKRLRHALLLEGFRLIRRVHRCQWKSCLVELSLELKRGPRKKTGTQRTGPNRVLSTFLASLAANWVTPSSRDFRGLGSWRQECCSRCPCSPSPRSGTCSRPSRCV
jgi:hypothetical protein